MTGGSAAISSCCFDSSAIEKKLLVQALQNHTGTLDLPLRHQLDLLGSRILIQLQRDRDT